MCCQPVRLSIQNLENRVVPAAFTPGNVVIYRVGDGAGALSPNGSAVFLDEYTPTGSLVQTVAMPTTASGNQRQLDRRRERHRRRADDAVRRRQLPGHDGLCPRPGRNDGPGCHHLRRGSPRGRPRLRGRQHRHLGRTHRYAGRQRPRRGIDQWDRPVHDHHGRSLLHRGRFRYVNASERYHPYHAVRERL